MKARAWLVLVLVCVAASAYGLITWRRQTRAMTTLTTRLREMYALPPVSPSEGSSPIASLNEAIPDSSTSTDVEAQLRIALPLIAGDRWLVGSVVGGGSFVAHEVSFSLSNGGTYPVVLVFRGGRLWDIDTPEYVGPVQTVPADSARKLLAVE